MISRFLAALFVAVSAQAYDASFFEDSPSTPASAPVKVGKTTGAPTEANCGNDAVLCELVGRKRECLEKKSNKKKIDRCASIQKEIDARLAAGVQEKPATVRTDNRGSTNTFFDDAPLAPPNPSSQRVVIDFENLRERQASDSVAKYRAAQEAARLAAEQWERERPLRESREREEKLAREQRERREQQDHEERVERERRNQEESDRQAQRDYDRWHPKQKPQTTTSSTNLAAAFLDGMNTETQKVLEQQKRDNEFQQKIFAQQAEQKRLREQQEREQAQQRQAEQREADERRSRMREKQDELDRKDLEKAQEERRREETRQSDLMKNQAQEERRAQLEREEKNRKDLAEKAEQDKKRKQQEEDDKKQKAKDDNIAQARDFVQRMKVWQRSSCNVKPYLMGEYMVNCPGQMLVLNAKDVKYPKITYRISGSCPGMTDIVERTEAPGKRSYYEIGKSGCKQKPGYEVEISKVCVYANIARQDVCE